MFQKFKTISDKLLAIGIIVAILVVVLIGIDSYQKAKQKEGLSDNLILKAPKENIIDYEFKPAKSPNATVKYRYISLKEVPVAVYDGLKEDVSKRTANSQTFLKSVKPISKTLQQEEYISKFYAGQNFQKNGDKWYYVKSATTTPRAFARQTGPTLLDQIKGLFGQKALADGWLLYSGAGDGYVSKGDVNGWAETHDASVGNNVLDYNQFAAVGSGYNSLTGKDTIDRSFLPFDTSSIPNDTVITTATLNVYTEILLIVNNGNDGKDYLGVVQTTQSSSANLTTSDYNEAGATTTPTLGANTIDITDILTNSYHTFTLDATGRGWIKRNGETSACGTTAGVTCLGLREGHDIENIEIEQLNLVTFRTSEDDSGSEDPYLTVNYTIIAPTTVKIDGGTIKIDGGTIKIN